MARFLLKNGVTLKDLGAAIFDLGALKSNLGKETSETTKDQIDESLILAERHVADNILQVSSLAANSTAHTKVIFHYDGIDTDTGDYMLHIVVPDLEGKRVIASQVHEDDYDFTDFATECMGQIVIFGCAK